MGPMQGEDEFQWFVGVDWGTVEHMVNVADVGAVRAHERVVAHTGDGVGAFVAWLTQLAGGSLARVAVAIEKPRGAVIEALLERGAAVFSVNPKQLDRFRDRFSPAGAKDDRLDAQTLRSALQTDRPYFRRLAVDEPLVIRVRELSRARDVLQKEFGALTNRLRELVHRVRPEWLSLSANADDPWFWALLVQAATPDLGRSLRRKKLESLLTTHRIRRVTVDALLEALHQPGVPVAPGTVEAVTEHIQLLVRRVQLVHEQREDCSRALDQVLDEWDGNEPPASTRSSDGAEPDEPAPCASAGPSDAAILRSLPGAGTVVTSTFLAEASPWLQARDYASLRAITGVAPVRRQTGKNKQGKVSMRYACSSRLRNACFYLASVSTQVDAAAKAYYARLRARGHSHGRALRSVADRWLRILMAMLKSKTLYDAARFATA